MVNLYKGSLKKKFSGTPVKSYKLAGPILSPWGVPLSTYSMNWALGLKVWRQVSVLLSLFKFFAPPRLRLTTYGLILSVIVVLLLLGCSFVTIKKRKKTLFP